jgi:hypothetical protein
MLTRGTLVALVALGVLAPATSALAGHPRPPIVVATDNNGGVVNTTVSTPGHAGAVQRVSASRSGPVCHSVPAVSPKSGGTQWGEQRNGYWGLYYLVYCSNGSASLDWVAQYPINPAGTVRRTAGVLAQRAVDQLPLPAPSVHHNPNRMDGRPETVVGIQTWWWLDPSSFRSITHTVRAGRIWARVTAIPTSTYWNAGSPDAPNVRCDGPGTPYDASRPANEQHTSCFTVYSRSSADQPQTGPSPNDRYFTASVTVTWRVTWVGVGGARGALPPIQRRITFPIAVSEVQTVNN